MRSLGKWVGGGWNLSVAITGLSLAVIGGCGESQPVTGTQAKSDPVEEKKVQDAMKEFMAKKAQKKQKKK